jgi:hypothetical protein
MASDSLDDFRVRMSEVDFLLASATGSMDATSAATFAKCAVVLACAAVERYMNDVLEEACRGFNEKDWDDLSDGRRRYLMRHIALRMTDRAGNFTEKAAPSEADCDALASFLRLCTAALDDPSSWDDFSDFGIFGEGTNAPNKIDAVLRAFDSDGRSVYKFMEESGVDLARVLSGLTQLVEARHGAAHALKGVAVPSPSDAVEWVGCARTTVDHVDEFLGLAPT